MNLPTSDVARPTRQDGEQSRERLLLTALALFAQHGFSKVSIRDIAEAAQTNVAAISYYFGDKAGLYRAAFLEPMGAVEHDIALFAGDELTLDQALRGFFAAFVEPLRMGEVSRQCMKLRLREMLEPTGLWEQEINQGIKPMHDALVAVLCRHFGLARADDELQRLAIAIAGLGVHLHVGRDVTDALVPKLNTASRAWDVWTDRLVLYALAMVAAELQRRAQTQEGGKPANWLQRVANSLCPSRGQALAKPSSSASCSLTNTLRGVKSAVKQSIRANTKPSGR